MNKLIFLLAFLFSFFIFTMVLAGENLYEDPRDRYTIVLPEDWHGLKDGRKDVFQGEKEDKEAYLTIMSFPPLIDDEKPEHFISLSLELLAPDEVLKQEEVELKGYDGAVIDYFKKIEVEEGKKIDYRRIVYIIFKEEEILTLTFESDRKDYSLFEEDFNRLIDSFKMSSAPFGGTLYEVPDGFYSLQLPYNWGIGPETDSTTDAYYVGVGINEDKGYAFCDVTKMARPLMTDDVEVILNYWKEEIKNTTDHKITKTETGFEISGQKAALLKHEYIEDTGRAHTVDDYIFIKGSYLFIITFDTKEDSYELFEKDFDFILKHIEIEI